MGGFDSWGSPSIILNCLLSLIICACTYHIAKNVKTTFTEAFKRLRQFTYQTIELSMQREPPLPPPGKKVMSTNVVPMVYGMICSSQSETQQVSKIAGDIQEFHPNNASAPIYSRAHKIAWHWNTNHEQVNYSIKKKGYWYHVTLVFININLYLLVSYTYWGSIANPKILGQRLCLLL